jgi:integrase
MMALRTAYSLGHNSTPRKVREIPVFPPRLRENVRKGFVEEAQYAALKKHVHELWLRGLLAVAYRFGFRKEELLDLRVWQVNLLDRTIRLNRGETKNDEPREVALTQDTWILLSALCAAKQPNDHVFTRDNGVPVRDLRDAWDKMTEAAGMPEILLHDFRRSAVRNMIRRGVPERVAMAISGHKTRDVFDRYNIVSGADLKLAAQQIEEGIPVEKHKTSTMAIFPQSEEASVAARKPS